MWQVALPKSGGMSGGGGGEWTGCYSNVCGHNDHCAGVAVCVIYGKEWNIGQGDGRGSGITLAIEIRQNIWHSMFATFATWPAADIYATTSAPHPPLPPPPFPSHNCHLIASFVLFYCHRG